MWYPELLTLVERTAKSDREYADAHTVLLEGKCHYNGIHLYRPRFEETAVVKFEINGEYIK